MIKTTSIDGFENGGRVSIAKECKGPLEAKIQKESISPLEPPRKKLSLFYTFVLA